MHRKRVQGGTNHSDASQQHGYGKHVLWEGLHPPLNNKCESNAAYLGLTNSLANTRH